MKDEEDVEIGDSNLPKPAKVDTISFLVRNSIGTTAIVVYNEILR